MLAFLHLPKTGGTSIKKMILDQGASLFTINNGQDARAFANLSAAELPSVAFGHMPIGLHQVVPHIDVHYAAFLRNPIDRLISAYLYVLRTPKHPQHDDLTSGRISFESYALEKQENDNAQTRRLGRYDWLAGDWWRSIPNGGLTAANVETAKETLDACVFVGIFEEFETSMRAFGERFGIRLPEELYRLNKAEQTIALSYDQRRAFERRLAHDWEVYEHARSLAKVST